jgi:glutamate-1-semialdehyde 2,1-aminomutase
MATHGYHGSHEAFEAGFMGKPWPHTLVADFGDAAAFEAVLAEHGSDIAAVFLEAVMGSSGVVTAPAAFFERVQTACRVAGALFVLDEVITLRLATGGQQAVLGIRPDLTTMGKIIGGGFPVGALGGRADLMALLDPRAGRLFHSGTFNGNPVTMAAGLVSVRELTADRIDAMDRQAATLETEVRSAAVALDLPFSVRRAGSLLNLYFSPTPPTVNVRRDDADAMARFHLAGLNHGLFFASRGMVVLSTVITDDDLAAAIDRFEHALADVAGERPDLRWAAAGVA